MKEYYLPNYDVILKMVDVLPIDVTASVRVWVRVRGKVSINKK